METQTDTTGLTDKDTIVFSPENTGGNSVPQKNGFLPEINGDLSRPVAEAILQMLAPESDAMWIRDWDQINQHKKEAFAHIAKASMENFQELWKLETRAMEIVRSAEV